MAWGLFEALGSVVEKVRGFVAGVYSRAVGLEIDFPTVSEALEAGGLEIEIPELHADFELAEKQTALSSQIATLASDQLIPGDMHLETDRLLPTRFAYEVEITQYDREGKPTTHPYYVGSDKRLTPTEILDIADSEAQNSPAEGAIGYEVGEITASWYSARE